LNALIKCIRGHVMAYPLGKENLPILYHKCNNGKKRICVAMSIGTLVTRKERIFGCIHMKL